VPVPGDPGAYTIQTLAGQRVTRAGTTRVTVPDTTVNAVNFRFEFDGSAGTQVDSVHIMTGQTVRWHLVAGTHTVTSGEGSSDPARARSSTW